MLVGIKIAQLNIIECWITNIKMRRSVEGNPL